MRPSLAKQLYLRLTLSLAVLWLGVVAAVAWVVQYEAAEVFDSGLQEISQRLLPLAVRELRGPNAKNGDPLVEFAAHDEYLTYQVLNARGVMLLRSHAAPDVPFNLPMKRGLHQVDGRYFYVESSSDGEYWIALAERDDHREHTLYGTLKVLLQPLLALLPVALLVTYLSVRDVRKSILALDQEIAKRGSQDLDPIGTDRLPIELLRLGETLNLLMLRLKAALESERNFAANSAHELRTPIASAMAQLDVLRDEVSDPGVKNRVLIARNMMERLEQMATKLLQLSRAESGVGFNVEKMDLSPLTAMLLRDLSFRSSRRVDYSSPQQPVWIFGDMNAAGIVIQNLLENAERYGEPGTPIQVEISTDGILTVRNDCKAIPESLLRTIRNRFVRGDQTKSGSGIGLSIVETLLAQSGASLKIESPCFSNGRGFCASVQFVRCS
jgi:two-component system, OmpR family, sensor kinase